MRIVRKAVIRWAWPQGESTLESLHRLNRTLSAAADEAIDRGARGDLAFFDPLVAHVQKAESQIVGPLFAVRDAVDGTPYASRGLNAPGKWAEANRKRMARHDRRGRALALVGPFRPAVSAFRSALFPSPAHDQ